jgi:ABC-type sugar transport system substrate-binding protein
MGDKLTQEGWTYSAKDAQGDPAAQVSFVETTIASGTVGALMVAAMDVTALQSVVEEAQQAGIIVVYLGAEPTDYTIASEVKTAYEITGYYAVVAAETWAAEHTDTVVADSTGKIPVAIDVYEDILDGRYRSNAFRDRTTESETLYVYNTNTTYGDDAETLAYTWAETMMLANPDLRIFLAYEPDCAYGVCNYLAEYAADNGLDLANFCVICCYEDEETPTLLQQAIDTPSSTAFKGYVTYGEGPEATGTKLYEEISGLAAGTWDFGVYYYDTIKSNTSFGFDAGWTFGDENPAAQYKY